jgi:hypothetical protein
MTAGKLVPEMKQLRKDGASKRAIAKPLGVSRTSVIRLLRSRNAPSLAKLGPFSSSGTGFHYTGGLRMLYCRTLARPKLTAYSAGAEARPRPQHRDHTAAAGGVVFRRQ